MKLKQTIIPNFCGYCGEPVPDKMDYKRVHVEETPKEVRVAICSKCGKDLIFQTVSIKGE